MTCDDLRWEFGRHHSVQTVGVQPGAGKAGSPVYRRWHDAVLAFRGGQPPAHGAIWLTYYPTVMVEWYPHVLVVSTLFPQGPRKTLNLVEFFYPEEIAAFEREFVEAQQAAYMETCVEDDEIALRMDAGRKALLDRGDDETGPYQSPMEDGMQHFHEWYRREMGSSAPWQSRRAGARAWPDRLSPRPAMPHTTLISAARTRELLAAAAPLVLLDCRFDLADTGAGERDWAAGHLPGALYAHLDRDLSGASAPGRNGRHPLPARADVAAHGRPLGHRARRARSWPTTPRAGLMRRAPGGCCAGWATTAVGGARRRPRRPGWPPAARWTRPCRRHARPHRPTPPRRRSMPTIATEALQAALGQRPLLDARAAERFRGEVEPLDPVAGHIPGATLRFFRTTWHADGRFKPAAQLRAEFERARAPAPAPVVHQCGSGVTACHNLLAMAARRATTARVLYPGSWSEWCSDPARPVARG